MRIISGILMIMIMLCIGLFSSCSKQNATDPRLERAEGLMAVHPDSALMILKNVKIADETSRDYALWCLLMSWAEYRNYIDSIPENRLQAGFYYFIQTDDHDRRALAYFLRGVIHEEKKIGDEADFVKDLMRASQEVELTEGNLFLKAQIYHRYGVALEAREKYPEAVEAFLKFRHYSQLSHSVKSEIIALINLSQSYMMQGDANRDYSTAIAYADSAIALATRDSLLTEYGKAVGVMSHCASRANQPELALKYAIIAKDVDLAQFRLGERKEPVRYVGLADAHRKLGDADSAIYYCNKDLNSENIYTRAGANQLMYFVYRDNYSCLHNYVVYISFWWLVNVVVILHRKNLRKNEQ